MDAKALKGPYTGDIVLLNSGDGAKKNKLGQKLATGLEPKYTHVALCLGLGKYFHASPPSVDFAHAEDLFNNYDEWCALRHRRVAEIQESEYQKVFGAAFFYLKMGYVEDKRDFITDDKLENETFCSLLVRDVFSKLGFEIVPDVLKPLPVHFQALTDSDPENWRDVTDEHKIGIDILRRYPDQKQQAQEFFNMGRQMQNTAQEAWEMHRLGNEMLAAFRRSDAVWGISSPYPEMPEPKFSFEYWNVPKKKKLDEER